MILGLERSPGESEVSRAKQFFPFFLKSGILGKRCISVLSASIRFAYSWPEFIGGNSQLGREVGGGFKREGTYVYLWRFKLMYDKNHHNIVKELSSN